MWQFDTNSHCDKENHLIHCHILTAIPLPFQFSKFSLVFNALLNLDVWAQYQSWAQWWEFTLRLQKHGVWTIKISLHKIIEGDWFPCLYQVESQLLISYSTKYIYPNVLQVPICPTLAYTFEIGKFVNNGGKVTADPYPLKYAVSASDHKTCKSFTGNSFDILQ